MNLDNTTLQELEKLESEKNNEHRLAMSCLETVELQDNDLARKVAEIQLQRKNLSPALIQGKYNARRLSSELKTIKSYIYKRLRGE